MTPARERPSARTVVISGVAVSGLLAWFLLPALPLVFWAAAERWSWPDVLPQAWGLRGWREAASAGLSTALARSAVLGLGVAAVATPLGALAGRSLGWRLAKRPWIASTVLISPIAVPAFAVATGLDTVVLRLRIPANFAVVATLAVLALPYTTYLMRAAYAAADPELEAQARMLGARPRQVLWSVTLPALRPALLAAAAMAFLVGWSDYIVTLVLGGGRLVTVPLLLAAAASGTGNEPAVAAIAVATAMPLLSVLTVGYLLRGVRRQRLNAVRSRGGAD